MKHSLIILISLLLLTSPVIGQETGVLYLYETSNGIKWKTFGNEKLQPKYEGEIKNGEMDGLGFMTYPYGEKSVVGEWKNGKEWNTKHTKKDGKRNGQGTMTYSDGDKYVGEYKNGKQNGQGTYTFSNGDKYAGEYKDGKIWNGTEYDKDGNIEWKFVKGKMIRP